MCVGGVILTSTRDDTVNMTNLPPKAYSVNNLWPAFPMAPCNKVQAGTAITVQDDKEHGKVWKGERLTQMRNEKEDGLMTVISCVSFLIPIPDS